MISISSLNIYRYLDEYSSRDVETTPSNYEKSDKWKDKETHNQLQFRYT